MQQSFCTCNGDVDYDDDQAQDDGDDAEQASQPPQPPGPVDVPHLQAVPGLDTQRRASSNRQTQYMHLM